MKIKYLLLISSLFIQSNIKTCNLKTSQEEKVSKANETFYKMIDDLNAALAKAQYPLINSPDSGLVSDDIDAPINMDGESLLVQAVRENQNLDLIKLLLEFGADPLCIDNIIQIISLKLDLKFAGPSEYEEYAIDPKVLRLLREYLTPEAKIIRGAKRGDLEKIEILLNHHHMLKNINQIIDANGKTPLIWAVIFDKPNIVEYFLNNGADYTIRDNSGNSFEDYVRGNSYIEKLFNDFKKEIINPVLNQALPVAMPDVLKNMIFQYI